MPATDKTAAQFVELLHELIELIAHRYAQQVHRYHQRQREIRYDRQSPSSTPTDARQFIELANIAMEPMCRPFSAMMR